MTPDDWRRRSEEWREWRDWTNVSGVIFVTLLIAATVLCLWLDGSLG